MSGSIILSLIVVIASLAFIAYMALKGYSPFLCCIIGAVAICLVAGLPLSDGLAVTFAQGTANMVKNMLLFYCACTLFGTCMQESGMAHSIAYFIADRVPCKWAPTVVFVVTVILALGGMLIGTCIVVYPIALIMFSRANYSKDLLAGVSLGGFWTVTCCSPFIPSAGNTMLMNLLGTNSSAGTIPGIAASAFIIIATCAYAQWQAKHWQKKGRVFEDWDEVPEDNPEFRKGLPSLGISLLPIVLVLVLYNVLGVTVALAMLVTSLLIVILSFKKHSVSEWFKIMEKGLYEGARPCLNLAVMGGIGAVIGATPVFTWAVEKISASGVHPYVLCWGAGAIMAGLVGSGTSGLATVVPHLLPLFEGYVAQGYNLGVMHRLLSVGSVSLDSLPHNGSLIGCCSLLHTTVGKSYWPVFWTCTMIPLLAGGLVALPLAMLGLT